VRSGGARRHQPTVGCGRVEGALAEQPFEPPLGPAGCFRDPRRKERGLDLPVRCKPETFQELTAVGCAAISWGAGQKEGIRWQMSAPHT